MKIRWLKYVAIKHIKAHASKGRDHRYKNIKNSAARRQ